MTREELLALKIKPINKKIEKEVKAIWDGIAKPLDGLGEFELLLANCLPASEQSGVIPPLIFPEKQWL